MQSGNVMDKVMPLLRSLFGSRVKSGFLVAAIAAILYVIHSRSMKEAGQLTRKLSGSGMPKKKSKGHVDKEFFRRLPAFLKVAIPSYTSREFLNLIKLVVFLALRTWLSIRFAAINGTIVKAIVKRNFPLFVKRLIILACYAVPGSFINSYLDFLNRDLAMGLRENMTKYFHDRYLKGLVFYQMTNLDARITNPDQRMTQDLEKWCHTFAGLFINFTKPFLDIILFSRKLARHMGWQGPAAVVCWYLISGIIIRYISPPFGKLTAMEQKLEGEFRSAHHDVLTHSEEIAFYHGNAWEKTRLNNSFASLMKHIQLILGKRLFLGTADSLLVKYGVFIVGYSVLGLPVFGPGSDKYLKQIEDDSSSITRDYIRNSSLLINLSKAIGRIVISYKDIQNLAGYTSLIHELKESLDDLDKGTYVRRMLSSSVLRHNNGRRGEVEEAEFIRFDDIPIVAPNGEALAKNMTFELKPGMHCFIAGPNGCGKSSLFRIMGELWPIFGGKLSKPSGNDIFYIPQRAYLPVGSLRDQIIYPDNKLKMLRKGVRESELEDILERVHLHFLIKREGGFDAENDWTDVLSGGEKQRMAFGRILYHKPKYAILDECSSAVSVDVEGNLYARCKELGITLITVSHRHSLSKYHDYVIKMDGSSNWTFEQIVHEEN